MFAAAVPEWTFHVEVWLLVAALAGLGVYTARVIQPKVVAAGEPPITRHQKIWFWAAVAVLYISTDWPMHDIAEQRLYSVHMLQHTLLMVVFPPMILLATPTWLARLIVGDGLFKRFVYFWARPAPALIVNIFLTAAMHWAWVVNSSVENAWVHYSVHSVAVFSSLFVWMCICGPLPELRVGPPMKMLVIFLLSVIPAFPAAFLTTAEEVLYQNYNTPIRLWGLSVEYDQQLAGVVMKVISGFYLWGIIAAIFFKWSLGERGEKAKYRGKLVPSQPTDEHQPV
jgi:putative membrane protein